jgi:hypothetical protein
MSQRRGANASLLAPFNFCIHPAVRPINTSMFKGVATTG